MAIIELEQAESGIVAPFSEVARHPNDPEVAIVQNKAQFLAAAQNDSIRAIEFDGYENPELEAYLDSAGEELSQLSIRTTFEPGKENLELREAVDPILYDGINDMGRLFLKATGDPYARVKILHPETYKSHNHLTTDMTYGFISGTGWENGQAKPRKPFLFKPYFLHFTPKPEEESEELEVSETSSQTEKSSSVRMVLIFESPEPTLETTKSFGQSFKDFLHTLGL